MNSAETLESQVEEPKQPEVPFARMERPQVFYDVGRKDYWILDERKDWITVNETALKRHLRACGFAAKPQEGERLSALDQCLNTIQLKFNVAYAGPLAGYQKGPCEMCGNRILVTSSPKLIQPQEGMFRMLDHFLQNLFPGEERLYAYGWLKVAYESLLADQPRPGQVLVLAGEKNSGKSLLQNLITEMLGGRAAKPYRYMSGGTDFNGELFGAEHLIIEDEIPSTDIRSRRAFGARIKDFTVNEVQSCHAKNRNATHLKPFWRLSVSLNDEPENLMILPPLDESLGDKMMLLKVAKAQLPMPTYTLEERREFWRTLVSELPAFLHFLTKWSIPETLRCERFGITHFHDPELLEALDELAPEVRFLALLDDWFRTEPVGQVFEGSAERLQSLLFNLSSLHSHEAKKLLHGPNSAATYLGRLLKKYPERIEYKRTGSERIWRIRAPANCPVVNASIPAEMAMGDGALEVQKSAEGNGESSPVKMTA